MERKEYKAPSLLVTNIDADCQLLAGTNVGPSGAGTSTDRPGQSAAPESSGQWIDDEE